MTLAARRVTVIPNVNDEPDKTATLDLDLDSGWDLGDEDDDAASARPTLAPPFDLASYAKESMTPSARSGEPSGAPTPRPLSLAPPPMRPSMMPRPDFAVVPNRVISLPPPPPLPNRAAPRIARPLAPLPSTAPTLPSEVVEALVAASQPPGAAATPVPPPQATPFPATAVTPVPPALSPATKPPPSGSEAFAAFSSIITPVPPSSSPPSQRITPREMQALEAALVISRQEQSAAASSPRGDTLLALANQRAPLLTPPRVAAVTLAVSTVPPAPEPVAVTDPIVEMQERFALGDYSGALVMAESMLDENPTHVEAREYADSCRAVLQQMYTARIGPLDRVPVVDVARDQLRWLSIDHRTGFILSLVDGFSSLEMILDVCGMPPLDALRMLFELVQQRIISIRDE